ncbi:hypothetical protein FKP32DRAFT_528998 [Trametes sanguinea]|nr:hypothetical protein FKP32DRAFT_528998 [Trametes sanguinea]
MSTRQRTAATSRKDAYGLWRPSDSDSDRPQQTMASSQRHHVDKTAVAEGSRKHRSSRRADPSDPVAVQHHQHKSSSKERTSATLQSSSYGVPQAPQPSSHRTQDVYGDAYSLRAYIKKKTDKRSPRSSNEKFPVNDDPYGSYSGYPSRQEHATAASYAQPPASTNYYSAPADHKSRDPTSSSRHHRERDKDREKPSRRDGERPSTRDRTVETSEERRRRKEKEAAREKERSSKDRDRHKEKERSKTREARAAVDHRQPDAASLYQTYTQPAAPAQRSADRLPSAYPDYGRMQQPQAAQATPASTAPWAGLTAGGRAPSTHTPAPAADTGYPSASDREDPPLPIPPPGHRRDRSDSKTHRSRHQVLAQQAAQDSGISSSEQEQSGMERARRHATRGEQASVLNRGQSSGPSGSENEKPPTIQKERRKHRTHGESSRHKSRTTHTDGQQPSGPTSSQEIASAWYQRHVRDGSSSKQPQEVPSRPPTTAPHDPVSAQSAMPPTVSIRAGQGPSDPHAGTVLPKISSTTSVARQGDLQPADRTYEGTSRSQSAAQYYQQTASRQQDSALPQTTHAPATHESSRAYQQQAYATQSATRGQQAPAQGYPPTASHSRHAESSGVAASAMQGTQPLPDVVVRPPSAAPAYQDPYASRETAGAPTPHLGGQSGGRLQVPPGDSRSRSTPAPSQQAGYSHATQSNVQQASHPHTYGSSQHADANGYRAPAANTSGGAYYGSSHTKAASQDLPSRFPVYEDATAHVQSTHAAGAAGYGSQHTGVAYPSATQASNSRPNASTTQGQPSASPKRNLTFPGATAPPRPPSVHINPSNYQGAGSYDPRSISRSRCLWTGVVWAEYASSFSTLRTGCPTCRGCRAGVRHGPFTFSPSPS